MPSLLSAIEAKYGSEDQEEISEAPIGIYVPRVGPRKSIPRLLILNSCSVDSAGDEELLQKICAGVLEIDLAHNNLCEWSEISKILSFSPSVTLLNLSFNNLSSELPPQIKSIFPSLPNLTTLILINTNISWEAVWFILDRAKNIREMHLSINGFESIQGLRKREGREKERERERFDSGFGGSSSGSESESESSSSSPAEGPHLAFEFGNCTSNAVDGPGSDNQFIRDCSSPVETPQIDITIAPSPSSPGEIPESEIQFGCSTPSPTETPHCSSIESSLIYPSLTSLMFDSNPITSFSQIAKFSSIFPNLRHLALSDCPITRIDGEICKQFKNLEFLSLSNTLISNLTDLENLINFPKLTDLRITGIPAFNVSTAFERRQLLIALLPNIKKLNGGAKVSSSEREDAERAFVRKFNNSSDSDGVPLKRFQELIKIHGKLEPLVDFQLKPASRVKIRIVFETVFLDKNISVYTTVGELKTHLEPLLGLSPSKMLLFYIDPELQGIFGRE